MENETITLLKQQLWPLISERQKEIVEQIISGFSTINTQASERIIIRYLRKALESPKHIGFNPELNLCGCDKGFVIYDDRNTGTTVAKCHSCYDPEKFQDIPPSFIERSI